MFRLGCAIVALACLMLTGCSQEEPITQVDNQSANNQMIALVAGSPEITKYLPKSPEILVMGDNKAPIAEWIIRPSGYVIRISLERGYLGGCINRNVLHLGVLVRRVTPISSWEMFNGHVAAWSNGWWQKCAAIYESRTGWCKAWCNPTFRDIQGGWYDAFITVGASAAVAWWLATIITPVSVGALAI